MRTEREIEAKILEIYKFISEMNISKDPDKFLQLMIIIETLRYALGQVEKIITA